MHHYHDRGHPGGHTIERGAAHARAILEYLWFAGLSSFAEVSAILGALSLVGACHLVRRQTRWALVLLSVPALYITYFSQQRVLIVRNYLLLLPIVAVCSARGCTVLTRAAARGGLSLEFASPVVTRRARQAVALLVPGAVALLISSNALWSAQAALSIARHPDPVRGVAAYVRAHPTWRFWASPKTFESLATYWRKPPKNVVRSPEPTDADVALYTKSEVLGDPSWTAYRYDVVVEAFPSHDLNYNYYPSMGDAAFVAARAASVRR